MAASRYTSRSLLRSGYGAHAAAGHARRYDAPSAHSTTRYDAPTSGSTNRLTVPAARLTQFRAPSAHIGTSYDAPAARMRKETDA